MRLLSRVFVIVAGMVFGHAAALAQTPAAKNDYCKPETWLCRPGGQDACAVDLTTTVDRRRRAADAGDVRGQSRIRAIDCFYVYPTVSLDPGGNSDMTAGHEERNVVRAQFARFRRSAVRSRRSTGSSR